MKLRDLRQGSQSLSEFINTVQLLVPEFKYPLDSDRLLWDVIVSGVNSTTAYRQCIDIGLDLPLEKAIEICTAEDSTRRQIESLRPDVANITPNISALDKKRSTNSMPDEVHQREHLLNVSTQNLCNSHSLITLSARAHRHIKTDPNVLQSTKSATLCTSLGTLTESVKSLECHPIPHEKHKSNTYICSHHLLARADSS